METSDVSESKIRYYVYVLFSLKDKGLYIGYTSNLQQRLRSHNKGENISTKKRTPFQLIYAQYFVNKADAKAREVFLKSGHGRRQLEQILKNTFTELHLLN